MYILSLPFVHIILSYEMIYKLISLNLFKLNYRVVIYCFSILNSYYAPTYYLLLPVITMCSMCRVCMCMCRCVCTHTPTHLHPYIHTYTPTPPPPTHPHTPPTSPPHFLHYYSWRGCPSFFLDAFCQSYEIFQLYFPSKCIFLALDQVFAFWWEI